MPSKDELQIRPIELADVPALLTIIAESRAEYGIAQRGAAMLSLVDREFYANYQRQRSLYFVALLDGAVVGGAGVAPLAGADPLTCELQRPYLRADARGRGVGDALLERCLAAARQFLYVRCYLETQVDSPKAQIHAALEFYGRHGFRDLPPAGARAPQEPGDHWMMRNLRASAREGLRAGA